MSFTLPTLPNVRDGILDDLKYKWIMVIAETGEFTVRTYLDKPRDGVEKYDSYMDVYIYHCYQTTVNILIR